MSTASRPIHPLLAGTTVAGALAVLLGAGAVLPPPPPSPGGWIAWLEGHGPAVAALATIRLAALATFAYVAALALVASLAAHARLATVHRLARAVATPSLRRALPGLAGVGLAVPVGLPAGAAPTSTTTAPATTTAVTLGSPAADDTATLRPLDDGASSSTTSIPPPRPPPAPPPPPRPAPIPSPAPPSTTVTHTIEPGDHLWGISERALAVTWGRAPTDADVASYLHDVVAGNAHVLVAPGQPDLVLPGQVFTLPPVPPPPTRAGGHSLPTAR